MKRKIKVMTIFGTRPEAIKMAPVIIEMQKQSDFFIPITVVTGQHREMLKQVMDCFELQPDYDLDIMKKNQSLTQITSSILQLLEAILVSEQPDIVLVHGDTTTALSASLAAFYQKITIGHVEAGLRTWNKFSPYPEEANRQLIDQLTDLFFVPTKLSRKNLVFENHEQKNIFVTGNTIIDAVKWTVKKDYQHEISHRTRSNSRKILITMHRRENMGEPMRNVFKAIKILADRYSDVDFIFPMHLNPNVRRIIDEVLGSHDRVFLIEPLDVIDFHNIAARSYMILTDSGGIQEEAPSLDKPVLVLRNTTERPEGVKAGALKLIGTETEDVIRECEKLLNDSNEYYRMKNAVNPYGDGMASKRILQHISDVFSKK